MNDNEWKPEGLPEIKRDFEASVHAGTKQDQSHDKTKELSPAQKEYQRYFVEKANIKDQEQIRKPATKTDLEKLISERQTPKPTLEYNMGGVTQKDDSKDRENRITALVERLAPVQNVAKDSFNMAADSYLHDKARAERELGRD